MARASGHPGRGRWGATGSVIASGLTACAGREVARVRFTDVFVRMGGRWQAVSAQETLLVARAQP